MCVESHKDNKFSRSGLKNFQRFEIETNKNTGPGYVEPLTKYLRL